MMSPETAPRRRENLPNRRPSDLVTFQHGAFLCTGAVSFFDSLTPARPAEVFLDVGKPGSDAQAAARDAAVVASIALQYGAPFEVIRHALTRLGNGAAAGPLGALFDAVAGEMSPADPDVLKHGRAL